VLLFTPNQSTVLISGSFPRFGVAASSLIGLSSYLILVGIYCSASSLANDSKLRQTIRQSAVAKSKFLASISTVQMQKEIEGRVMRVAKEKKDTLIEKSNDHPSLTDVEMKQYLKSVLDEIKYIKIRDHNLEKSVAIE